MTTTTINEFAGYPLYNDIINPTLRTWNRVNTVFNIKDLIKNDSLARDYVAQLNQTDRLAVWSMCLYIIRNGYENTRREIMRKNNNV